MRFRIFLSFFIFFCMTSFGQTIIKKQADRSYEIQDYITAANAYEKLIQKGDSCIENMLRLADSYYFNSKYNIANKWYANSYKKSNQFTANQFHRYFQTLKTNGDTINSKKIFDDFKFAFPSDLRIKNHLYSQYYFLNHLNLTLKNLEVNSAFSDFGASFYKDTLLFTSARPTLISSTDYYRTEQPFTNLFYSIKKDSSYSNVNLFNKKVTYSVFHEATPIISKDGRTMYYTKNELLKNKKTKAYDGLFKLYKAVFENGKWVDKGIVDIPNSDGARIAHPTLSLDEKTLYFAAELKSGYGQSDIYSVTLKSDGSFGQVQNLGTKINTEGRESFPFITENNILVFASDGHPGFGGFDLFAIDLTNQTSSIINLGRTINSPEDDFNFVQKSGTNEGVFSSNRKGGKGDDDLYSFVLYNSIKSLMNNIDLNEKDAPIIDSTIRLIEKIDLDTISIRKDTNDKFDFSLNCVVTDSKTNQLLDSVEVTIFDNLLKLILTKKITSIDGSILESLNRTKLNDSLSITITLKKRGYFTKVVNYNSVLSKAGVVNINETIDLSLTKMEKGMDLAKIFNINPIYFDVNKSNIRPDATKELNKIIAVMNENPTLEIELGSHTDCRAPKLYNEKLSDQRAKASAAYIKLKIVNPSRINGIGYGESKLITDCPCEGNVKSSCSEADHQMNRRTEFKIIKH